MRQPVALISIEPPRPHLRAVNVDIGMSGLIHQFANDEYDEGQILRLGLYVYAYMRAHESIIYLRATYAYLRVLKYGVPNCQGRMPEFYFLTASI